MTWLRIGIGLLGVAIAARVHAGATTPKLVLSVASAQAVAGARSATFEGNFDFSNALELGYPIDLVVYQGTSFARYPFAGQVVTGTSPELSDGILATSELSAFLSEGAAAPAEVRIVSQVADRMLVTLPSSFTAGSASAVVFAILPDGSVVSNPITLSLP